MFTSASAARRTGSARISSAPTLPCTIRCNTACPARCRREYGVEPDKGCPFDCGLCTEHEQHTCVGLVEMTSSCNLAARCATRRAGRAAITELRRMRPVDRPAGRGRRPRRGLQLSGGEPTIHPEFLRVLEYAGRAADRHRDDQHQRHPPGPRRARCSTASTAKHRGSRSTSSSTDSTTAARRSLRGEALVETKLKAIEALGRRGIKTSLVCTLQPGVNDHEIGAIVRFGLERPWITGISFQPATYSGRHVLPEDLERRITFPDVIRAIAEQTDGRLPRGRLHAAALCTPELPQPDLRLPLGRPGRAA